MKRTYRTDVLPRARSMMVGSFLLILLVADLTFGCQYTVRDVGFTDLGSSSYLLYLLTDPATPAQVITDFRHAASATLMDSNVEFEVADRDQPDAIAAREAAQFWNLVDFPAAVLLHPNGASLPLSLPPRGPRFKRDLGLALEDLLTSPVRREILEHIVKAYGIILWVQGTDEAENERVAQNLKRAIKQLTHTMQQLPQSIEEPPYLIRISPEQFRREKVLLWSLGIHETDLGRSHVAVLYGRGRQMGPLLRGADEIEQGIFRAFSAISSSCNCDLDRSWILGPRIPLRWSIRQQTEVVRSLGFDAESPLVKAEISQILAIETPGRGSALGTDPALLAGGYSEQPVAFTDSPQSSSVTPAQLSSLTESESGRSESGLTFRLVILTLAGMVLLVMIGGGFLLWVARRRES